eukprot:scaffold6407_cov133-Skeletonema_dohrnii-CCMP3373.AAC.1
MCPLGNCGFVRAHASSSSSWFTIIAKTFFFGTSHRDIVNSSNSFVHRSHLHIISCVRSFVDDIYERDADAQDTNTRDLFFSNSDTESFNNAQSSWFIQVDLSLDDNGVYSLRFYAGSHLVRSDIIRQDQGHMTPIRRDINMSAFPDFCIIKQAMFKELCYDELHNTDISARIPMTFDVIDSDVDIHSCSDAKSCGSDKDLSEDVCDYDDTLLSRRIVRHHTNQSSCSIAISVGLGHLYVQLSDVVSKPFGYVLSCVDRRVSYGEPTSVSGTHCTRVASYGVHSARITLYWFIVPSHEDIDRRSRQHRCVILRENGERLYTTWINVPNLIETSVSSSVITTVRSIQ